VEFCFRIDITGMGNLYTAQKFTYLIFYYVFVSRRAWECRKIENKNWKLGGIF
jgi:hypothetical protein